MSKHPYKPSDVPDAVADIINTPPEEMVHTDLRFFVKSKHDEETGCLLWTASTNDDGYGQFYFDGGARLAHRVAYERHVGNPDNHEVIRHKCHRRRCVNPDHLIGGSQDDNVQDAIDVGADIGAPSGTDHPLSLPTDTVQNIMREYASGSHQPEIADNHDIAVTSVGQIIRRESYQDVPLPDDVEPEDLDTSQRVVTDETAREIRRRYNNKNSTYSDLADEYDIALPTVGNIVRGDRGWEHL